MPFFSLFLWYCLSQLVSAQIPRIDVGTTAGAADVVSYGIVNFLYLDSMHVAVVTQPDITLYYNASRNVSLDSLTISERPMFSGTTCVLNATLVPYNHTMGRIELSFLCTNGTAVIDLVLNFSLPVPYLMNISFSKHTGQYRDGFMIGESYPYSDVVFNGTALPLWIPSTSHKVKEYVFHQNFFITLADVNDSQAILTPEIFTNDTDIVTVNLTGSASDGGIVSGNGTLSLMLNFHCKLVKDARIIVRIQLAGSYVPILFGFEKVCSTPETDFNIGTVPQGNDVIDGGTIQLMWAKMGSAFFQWYNEQTAFYVNALRNQSVIQNVTIKTVNDTAACYPWLVPQPYFNHTATIIVNFNCSSPVPGSSQMVLSLYVEGEELPVQLYWHKYYRVYHVPLDLGLDECNHNVVHAGFVSMMYQPSIATAFLMSSHDYAFFYVSTSNDTNYQQPINITSIIVFPVEESGLNGANCTTHVVAPPPSALSLARSPDDLDEITREKQPSADEKRAVASASGDGLSALSLFARLAKDVSLGPNGGIILPGMCYKLTIFHYCPVGPAYSLIQVNITTDAFPPTSFRYYKFSGGYRTGFSIGRLHNGSDVAHNGIALPLYHPFIFSPSNGFNRTNGNTTSDTFYVSMHDKMMTQMFNVTVQSQMKTILNGTGAHGGNATPGTNFEIIVNYVCEQPEEYHIILNFTIPPYVPVAIEWIKECGLLLENFQMGSEETYTDVINNGRAQPGWRANTPDGGMVTMPGAALGTRFWLALNGPGFSRKFQSPESQAIYIVLPPPNVTATGHPPVCYPYVSHPAFVVNGTNQYFDVFYNCSGGQGTALMFLTVYFNDTYMPMRIQWYKQIGGTRRGLFIGTTVNSGDVVRNGVVQGDWGQGHIIPAGDNIFTFYAYIVETQSFLNGEQVFSLSDTSDASLDVSYIVNNWTICTETGTVALVFNAFLQRNHEVNITWTMPGFDPLTLVVTKLSPGYIDNVTIGTTYYGNDVVVNGQATPGWSYYNDSMMITGNTIISVFFLRNLNLLTPTIPVISADVFSSSTECRFLVSPALTTLSRIPSRVEILYQCLSAGVVEVTMKIRLNSSLNSLIFKWHKQTGGSVREGLNVGTAPFGSNVVNDGVVVTGWRSQFGLYEPGTGQPSDDTSGDKIISKRSELRDGDKEFKVDEEMDSAPIDLNSPSVIGEWNGSTTFYYSMNSATNYPYQFASLPIVTVDNTNLCATTLTSNMANGGFINATSNLLSTITYNCVGKGVVRLCLHLSIPPFESVNWCWKKIANGNALGFYVVANESEFPAASSVVVSNAQVQNGWGPELNASSLMSNTNTFALGVEHRDDILTYPIQYISNITASILNATSGCSIAVTDNMGLGYIGGMAELGMQITLAYTNSCFAMTNFTVNVQVTFRDYHSISFAFFKQQPNVIENRFPVLYSILIVIASLILVFVLLKVGHYYISKKNGDIPPTPTKKFVSRRDSDDNFSDSDPLLNIPENLSQKKYM